MLQSFKDQETSAHPPSIKNRSIDGLNFAIRMGSFYFIAMVCNQLFKTPITIRYLHLQTAIDLMTFSPDLLTRPNQLKNTIFLTILVMKAVLHTTGYKIQSIFTSSHFSFKTFFYFAIIKCFIETRFSLLEQKSCD